jgi:feruloyl esterase
VNSFFKPVATLVISLLALLAAVQSARAGGCENLASLALPHATVTAAEANTSGGFTPPPASIAIPNGPKSFSGLPPYCRVRIKSSPTFDSVINIEIWIPLGDAWNGKYEQIGCGGFCGAIAFQYSSLARAITRGYAAAATDDGTQAGGRGDFALGHPEKITDFGYRALKETTDTAKAIIAALAGKGPQRSYFNGCSDGGREALMEAQRFPEDFDGIIVGAPANAWTNMFAGFLANEHALLDAPASYIPPTKLPILSKAALTQCTKNDGNAPGDAFVNDPLQCNFDPAAVQCKAGQDPSTCLTLAQVKAARVIYSGYHDPHTGKVIASGFEPGNESDPANWPVWITGLSREADLTGDLSAGPSLIPRQATQQFFTNSFLAYFVYQKPDFDYRSVDILTAVTAADKAVGKALNSTDPNLRPFEKHGGKIIQYHGWSDAALSPRNSVNYYNEVKEVMSGKATPAAGDYRDIQSFYRLFMVPGMGHCGFGPGATEFGGFVDQPATDADHDILKALERWVEQGVAPDKIIATHFIENNPANGVQFQRPLCPYPQIAHYDGHSDPSVSTSFTCR